jgi:hypothetical protein
LCAGLALDFLLLALLLVGLFDFFVVDQTGFQELVLQ